MFLSKGILLLILEIVDEGNVKCFGGIFQVAKLEAVWAPLIYAGIFAMSLSSTMTNLDNGPQVFQVPVLLVASLFVV